MRTLASIVVVATTVVATPVVRADSFEDRAAGAARVDRLDDLVWPYQAACDDGDDVQQRWCRQIRDRKVAQLAGATLLVEAEPGALTIGGWQPARRSLPLSLVSCISCGGVELDGKRYQVTGMHPRLDQGKLRGAILYDNAKTFPDEAAAAAWVTSLGRVRVELLAKVPANRKLPGGIDGLALDIVGWRVLGCDGTVVISNPASTPGSPDPQGCGAQAPAPK